MPHIITPPNSTEIVSERTLRSKTFDLGNNKRRLINKIAGVVHYDDGGLKDIDTTIRLQRGAYRVERTPYKLSIPTNAIGFDYVSRQGGKVSVRLVALDNVPIRNLPINISPTLKGSELWLTDVVPGLDLYFKARPAQVQIWKIVKTSTAPHVLTWEVTEDNSKRQFNVKTVLKAWDNQNNLPTVGLRADEKSLRREAVVTTLAPAKNPNGVKYTIKETLTKKSIRRNPNSRVKSTRTNETIYPVLIDQDITENIVANADDGHELTDVGAYWNYYNSNFYFGNSYSYDYHGGIRFQSVAVPAGATITLAELILDVRSFYSGTPRVNAKIHSDKVADAAAFSDSSRPSQITKSTASTAFQPTTTGDKTVTVTDQVQEIVDAGFASGNAMRFAILNQNSGDNMKRTEIYDYTSGSANVAQLQITYTVGGGATGKSNPLSGPLGGPLSGVIG